METHESTNKFLNLVFDQWDGESEILNLKELSKHHEFNHPNGFFDFYERYYHEHMGYDRNSLPIKKFKIEDVYKNPSKQFIYPIKSQFSLKDIFVDSGYSLPENVIKCLKECDNIILMFIREHESEFKYDIEAFTQYIRKHNLPEDRFHVLTNNSNNNDILKLCDSKINLVKLNLIKITSSSIFSEMPSQFKGIKEGKFFLCFNKNPKKHRIYLLSYLHGDILNNTNWSLIGTPDIDDIKESHNLKSFFTEESLQNIDFSIFDGISLKESDFEKGKNFFNSDLSVNYQDFEEIERGGGASGGLMLPEFDYIYNNSYVNIVTESIFEDSFYTIHITEKSIRPFHFYLFPIFVATQGHVKKLKEEYGFDVYDDIIDHSYDNEPDQKLRLKMVVDEINRIYENKDLFIEYYNKNQDRFEKNKKIVMDVSKDTTDFEYFKSLMD